MIAFSSLAFLLVFLQQCIAFNPVTDRSACDDGQFCLTSFVWCGLTNDRAKGCTYPEGAYALYNRDDPSNPAALIDYNTYNLTWRHADLRYPVLVEWEFGSSDSTRHPRGRYAINITDTHYLITFGEVAEQFPTSTYNGTVVDVLAAAADISNLIHISQPERPAPPGWNTTRYGTPYIAYSDQFAVFNSWVPRYIDTAADIRQEAVDHKWSLGVGIGVGVGVPILLIAAFAGGWFTKRSRTPKPVRETKHMSESSS